jgi:hypothetical protein
MKKLIVMLTLALCCLLLIPALASASTPTVKSLAKSLAALQKKVNAQAKTLTSLSTKLTADEGTIASQGTTIASLSSQLTSDEATIASQATTLTNAAPLLAIAPYVSLNAAAMNGVKGPNILFKGANVHVMSSTSETDGSGLGNLIVGWDTNPTSTPSGYRSGTNNLVAGDHNTFPSNAGLVAGIANTVGGQYSSVTGGSDNATTTDYASVSGGQNNTVAGNFASVSGGEHNTASGNWASVTGGGNWQASTGNTAAADYSCIVGGEDNSISSSSARWSVICGGVLNQVTGNSGTVGGGYGVTLSDSGGWAAGGSSQSVQYLTH